MDKELEEKIIEFRIFRTKSVSHEIDLVYFTETTLNDFKKSIDDFLNQHNTKDGTVSFSVDHDVYGYGHCCNGVIARMLFCAEVDKTEEELMSEVARCEIARAKEELRKQKQKKRNKKSAASQKLKEQAKLEKERKLYESLKKKFENK